MPWKIFKEGDKYCVCKENADGSKGEQVGCHPTEEAAREQQKALYVHAKEIYVEDEIVIEDKAKKQPPPSPASNEKKKPPDFPDPGEKDPIPGKNDPDKNDENDEQKKPGPEEKKPMPGKNDPDKNDNHDEQDKPKKKFSDMIGEAVRKISEQVRKPKVGESVMPKTGVKKTPVVPKKKSFLITKAKTGYRWTAIYSNNYKDRDNPPEIISAKAHERYVKEVDEGMWPMPELRHWHVKGTRWGIADMVAYDPETGFAIASGTVDKGHEKEAERLKEMIEKGEDIRVSHGFPEAIIERDPFNKNVITRYVDQEISDLPGRAAANALTGFSINSKEVNMPLPEQKKEYLKTVGEFSEEQIQTLEATLSDKAKEGEGIERKETEAPKPEEVKPEEVAEGIVSAVKPVMEVVEEQQAEIKKLQGDLEEVKEILKELKKSEDSKIAEKAAETPAFSIKAMVLKGLTEKRVPVSEKDPLFKAGPVMPKEQKNKRTGLFFDEYLK